MDTLDWIAPDVWYAHAIHVNDDELRLFAARGAAVSHCPSSNMRLASGIAPAKKYLDSGVRTGIGVDGSSSNDCSNLLLEARMALLLGRLKIGLLPPEGPRTVLSTSDPLRADEWLTARQVLEMATLGGASVLGRTAGGLGDPVAAVLFCAPQTARHTVIGGRSVVTDGRIATMEIEPVIEEHNRHALALLNDAV
jgi:cytosine/adenosine deaminase-related metal-dependent hydrolase